MLQVPVVDGGLQQRLGQRQPGVVDHQVHPAERQHARGQRLLHGGLVGDVDLDRDGLVRPAELVGDLLGVVEVQVGDDDTAALGRDPLRDGLADPRPGAGDQRDPGGQRLGPRASAASFASSRAQYSMRNFSASLIGA